MMVIAFAGYWALPLQWLMSAAFANEFTACTLLPSVSEHSSRSCHPACSKRKMFCILPQLEGSSIGSTSKPLYQAIWVSLNSHNCGY